MLAGWRPDYLDSKPDGSGTPRQASPSWPSASTVWSAVRNCSRSGSATPRSNGESGAASSIACIRAFTPSAMWRIPWRVDGWRLCSRAAQERRPQPLRCGRPMGNSPCSRAARARADAVEPAGRRALGTPIASPPPRRRDDRARDPRHVGRSHAGQHDGSGRARSAAPGDKGGGVPAAPRLRRSQCCFCTRSRAPDATTNHGARSSTNLVRSSVGSSSIGSLS